MPLPAGSAPSTGRKVYGQVRGWRAHRGSAGYQALYAFSVSLCIVSTYVSISLIILLQLNSALSPRIRWLDRS